MRTAPSFMRLFEFSVALTMEDFVDVKADGFDVKMQGAIRFDAICFSPWQLRKPGTVIQILEFKSSRQDFERDRKWPLYLAFGTLFGFLTPPGIINPSELPDGVGLFEYEMRPTQVPIHGSGGLYRELGPNLHIERRKSWRTRADVTPERRTRLYQSLSTRAINYLWIKKHQHAEEYQNLPAVPFEEEAAS